MRILVINNTGGGFADHVDVEEGLTVEALFARQVPHGKAADYLVRVNRQPVPAEQVLREGGPHQHYPAEDRRRVLRHRVTAA